jgi:hypothetical protein
MNRLLQSIVMLGMSLLMLTSAEAAAPDHQPWQQLLQSHVVVFRGGQATEVDYAGMSRDQVRLAAYLKTISAVTRTDFDRWPKDDQLAFLINAYNAWTVKLIVDADPGLESIRDLGSLLQSPWKKSFIPLLGETRSLDDIEHGLIRGSGRYGDPRIHFAVNCASIGCPALSPEAYVGSKLDRQLEQATRQFLADRTRNRLGASGLEVSSIFRWYKEDFAAGWRGARSLGAFLALYDDALGLGPKQKSQLAGGQMPISFLEYDWRLNGAR